MEKATKKKLNIWLKSPQVHLLLLYHCDNTPTIFTPLSSSPSSHAHKEFFASCFLGAFLSHSPLTQCDLALVPVTQLKKFLLKSLQYLLQNPRSTFRLSPSLNVWWLRPASGFIHISPLDCLAPQWGFLMGAGGRAADVEWRTWRVASVDQLHKRTPAERSFWWPPPSSIEI